MNNPIKSITKLASNTGQQLRGAAQGAAKYALKRAEALVIDEPPNDEPPTDSTEPEEEVQKTSTETRPEPEKSESPKTKEEPQDDTLDAAFEHARESFENGRDRNPEEISEGVFDSLKDELKTAENKHQDEFEDQVEAEDQDEVEAEAEDQDEVEFEDQDEFEDEFEAEDQDEVEDEDQDQVEAEDEDKHQFEHQHQNGRARGYSSSETVQNTMQTLFSDNNRPVRQFRAIFAEDNDHHEETRHLTLSTGAWNGESIKSEPDVLLDVPHLSVDKISLEVENLRAQVSLNAEVANLVSINVGANVEIEEVELEIEGVNAQALLKVRLDEVRGILDRALETLDNHPEFLTRALITTENATEDVTSTGSDVVDSASEALGGTAKSVTEKAKSWVGSSSDDSGPSIEASSHTRYEDS